MRNNAVRWLLGGLWEIRNYEAEGEKSSAER